MINYLQGQLTEKTPAYIVVECHGVGYLTHVSLNTYSQLQDIDEGRVYTYFHVKEDGQSLYGFAEKDERELFIKLISISGVGPNTARMVLSSLNPDEAKRAILNGDIKTIQSVKGIGAKTAQRIVLELRDKIGDVITVSDISAPMSNSLENDALSALTLLGFPKASAEKAIRSILTKEPGISRVEDLIKKSLQTL